jgi:hypothetical protein
MWALIGFGFHPGISPLAPLPAFDRIPTATEKPNKAFPSTAATWD